MKTAVIGASGYAGGELLRLLAAHPHFEVVTITAHSNAGELVTSVHPQLQSYAGRRFVTSGEMDFSSIELVFLALPHGESAALIAKIPTHVKIVDLGAEPKHIGERYALRRTMLEHTSEVAIRLTVVGQRCMESGARFSVRR